ncbi:hypothetical protein JN01_0485 [Entomoplasma freundtii]|uniref:Uncharacterized protein n=1 Tax=Entomoplasma freundtii TaxID=74700 RepID=A0A2K8NQJ3_9MOLU|nr:hypothetical protein [Entomoplasma freundtii]ATZ16115.1 hypothetical protein EFREU_v1c00880 [Entomoplasma freundtii]TDY56984.1 hypothetical protein JN01_0485 [Entomoplasma freundtii]
MSYKLENLTFTNKKPDVKLVNFNAQSKELTNLYLPTKKDRRFITNVLKGNEKLAHGRFRIDGNELIGGRFVKSKVAFIKTDKWLERLIPPRVILTSSQLFDIKFIRQARLKKNDKKYNYLSFADSRNDLSDMDLRRELDKVISLFLDDLTEIEKSLVRNFQNKIKEFNHHQTNKLFGDYYTQIQVLVREYASLSLKIIVNNLLLTFFQALWDQVYSFKDLRNSCPCEYNVEKSSNKSLNKIRYKFTYRQPYFMVEKRLKTINIRIADLRFLLFKEKRIARQIRKQIMLELHKYHQEHKVPKNVQATLKTQTENWEKIIKDITTTFEKSQQDFFYVTLPEEGALVRRRLIFLTHQYHKKVLGGSNRIGDAKEFKLLKKHYRQEIKGIYQQAVIQTKENLDHLNIKFDWYLKNGFKLSSLNIIYIKLLRAMNLKKNNIIFQDVFNLLTKNDYRALMNTMKNLNRVYPDLTFINLTGDFAAITDWGNYVYGLNADRELKALQPPTIAKLNAKKITESLPTSWNTFNYLSTEGGVAIGNTLWQLPKLKPTPSHKVFVNPFLVQLEPPTEVIKTTMLPMIIKTKSQTKFLDRHMILGVTKSGVKLVFYSSEILEANKERVIFIENRAIVNL